MARTNYNKMSNKPEKETPVETGVLEVEQTTEVIEDVVEETPAKVGAVTNCAKLNIRKAPKADAEIVGTLTLGDTVTILDEIDGFYKIDTNKYCMKKYISVK